VAHHRVINGLVTPPNFCQKQNLVVGASIKIKIKF
jgi:hypothetical protein